VEAPMKRWYTAALILVIALLFAGCAKAQIENAIQDFEDSVNDSDLNAFENLISVQSDFYITGPVTIPEFHQYLVDNSSIDYLDLDIDVNGSSARVYTNASYNNDSYTVAVKFIMNKDGGSDWRVKEYWDANNPQDDLVVFWQNIKDLVRKIAKQ
jgi:uncharacterized membrane protein YvbJ